MVGLESEGGATGSRAPARLQGVAARLYGAAERLLRPDPRRWAWNDRGGAWFGQRLGLSGLLALFVSAGAFGAAPAYWLVEEGRQHFADQAVEDAHLRAMRWDLVAAIDALAVALDAAPAGEVPVFRVAGGRGELSSRLMLPDGSGFLFPRREGGVLDLRIGALAPNAVSFTTGSLPVDACVGLLHSGLPKMLRGRTSVVLSGTPGTLASLGESVAESYKACESGPALTVEVRRTGS